MSIEIYRGKEKLGYKSFTFPSGEVSVKLSIKEHIVAYIARSNFFAKFSYQTIIARLQNSNDVMELLMIVDALRRIDDTPIRLFLLKIPYAQQDRVCDLGESHSLRVFADLINSLKFQEVKVFDPHSIVCEALINNIRVVTQLDIISKWTDLINMLQSAILIAPDSGSNKKVYEIAKFFQKDFVRADKLRDLTNGQIKETIVYQDDFKGKDVAILDDICLGGRTFIELAKVLKAKNCGKIHLFVTHGVFNNGLKALFEAGINTIWTTNSWDDLVFGACSDVRVLNLEEKFLNNN